MSNATFDKKKLSPIPAVAVNPVYEPGVVIPTFVANPTAASPTLTPVDTTPSPIVVPESTTAQPVAPVAASAPDLP